MANKYYQESKINENIALCHNYLIKIHSLNFKLENCENGEDQYVAREIDQQHFEFNYLLKTTYYLVLAYIETQENFELLKHYKKDLKNILSDDFDGITRNYIEEIEEYIYVSKELDKLTEFLIPYQAFDKESYKSIGLIYLENILSNTSIIIKELNIKPNSETQVYNSVKFVTKIAFPDSSFPSEPFYKTAKCYIPDILIPSLNTAIEYKYATAEKKLTETIEQILIDVVGYSNHPIFKNFYAVFYVKIGICDEKRFQIIWDGYKFPKNWKPIFVVGV